MKKLLFMFVLTLLPLIASAHDLEYTADGKTIYYNYINNDTELEVSFCGDTYGSYSNEYQGNVVIPEEVTIWSITRKVTSIGESAFRGCSGLTSVTIPNSVTSIGNSAFSGCSGLTSVTIPNGVTSIEGYTFSGCSGLTSITIPNSVTSIEGYTFSGCSGLTSITIPNSVTSIGDDAFNNCSGLTSIVVAQGNTKYDSRDNCNAIIESASNKLIAGCKTTIIPNSVTSIGSRAFYDCSGLTSITIPNSVTSIGDGAFSGCSGLSSVEFHCAQIDSWFKGMTSIKEVTIGNGVTSIGNSAFSGCSGLTSVTIGNSVTSIGNSAFSGCSGLSSVEFHCAQIGSWFKGMTSIKEVVIGNEVTSIGNSAFEYCTGLTSVTIGNSVTSIGERAFYYCSSLTSVTIPNSVVSIGNSAFYYCSGLTSVAIGSGVTSIGNEAFSCCFGLQKVIVPDIAAWCGISFGDNPLNYAHHIYSDENTEIKDLVIPNSVTSIRWHAFSGCSGLTSVTIPNSVTSIGKSAFEGCYGLTSVTIPNSVTSIGDYAFAYSGLTSFTIPNSVTYIGDYAFYNCSGLTSVTIPNSVTYIGSHAFYNCSGLMSVTIGSGVTYIGSYAFSCGIKLSTVNVNMNIPIEIDESVFEFTGENYSKDVIYLIATLNVPIGSKALYSNVKGWKKFMNINEVDFTPKHKLVYVVDGVEYKVYEIAEGATITPEPAPTKEGYTFSGWSEIPETMPAHDVTVTGSFTVNQYLITYMIGDEVYQKEYVDYGAIIVLPNVPEREGYSFAWIDAPEKMPAHDITINGAYTSGIWGVSNNDATTNTYTISGYKTDKPKRGVNIIRMSDGTTRKVVVK